MNARRAASGKAQIIHKEGHHTSRIHVEDLVETILASLNNPSPASVYNVVDDLPCGPDVPLELAYNMIGLPKPSTLQYDDIKDDLPNSINYYYTEDRRISNARIKSELGVKLKYPTYREGYQALNEARQARVATSG